MEDAWMYPHRRRSGHVLVPDRVQYQTSKRAPNERWLSMRSEHLVRFKAGHLGLISDRNSVTRVNERAANATK